MMWPYSEKNKSCSDRRVLLDLTNTHLGHISAYNYTKEDGSKDELLLLQDNLDDKLQKKKQDMCYKGTNTLF